MTNNKFLEAIRSYYDEALELLQRKNADYATEQDPFKNFRNAELVNVSVEKAILVRISDKMARISNILDKNGEREVKDETLKDSLIDVCNYAAILIAYLEDKK